ncbi:MAG: transcriptional regulator, AraC family [Chthonomonadaceae bacterium]|nr:transcriptional regulator, AraC family [Chthonomonadaceae bacterium]
MKLKPRIPKCAPDVRLDAPAEITMESSGFIQLDTPRNMLVSWERQRQFSPLSPSVLSVRWSENGQRFFDLGRRRYAVDDTGYMVFNNGTEFASEIDSETLVRCYTVNFVPGMAEETLRSLITPTDRLLDDPYATDMPMVNFYEKTYRHNTSVTPVLRRLARYEEQMPADHAWFEEQFRLLVEGLLHAHRNIFREMAQIPAIRAATREELYTRLHMARDFMEANLSQPLTIPQIARQACLSTHHFLRMFKQVFQETPHQYLTRRRMERARQMLLRSDVSVTQICFALGFESLGSFSTLFRARTGLSPEQFRLQARGGVVLSSTGRADRREGRNVESGGSLLLGLSLAPKEDTPTEGY